MLIQSAENDARGPSTTTAKDALEFIRRRRWLFLGVAAAIILSSIVLAFRLPPVYLSRATILIEQPAISEDIVASSITSYVDEQIQIVAQHIYTPDSVSVIIEKYDLYPLERQTESMAATSDRFVSATQLESIAAEVSDDRGRSSSSTFAFIVGFKYSDSEVAQKVTAELAQRFLDENLRSRTQKASTTTTFLENEAERLANEILAIESGIASFKDDYGDALPDQLMLNMDLLRRTESELNKAEEGLRALQSRQQILQAELLTLDPYTTVFSESGEPIIGVEQRLADLRQEYLQLSSRYGPEHPDVKRAKREIEAIGNISTSTTLDNVAQKRAALEMERDILLERYSAKHPDVIKLQESIDALPAEGSTGTQAGTQAPPNNLLYLQAQAQLEEVRSGLTTTLERRQLLTARQARLNENISMAPRIEQEWLKLSRGYNSARQEYEEIKRRSTAARLSERLEEQNKGERFTLLKRASLPDTPVEPNRAAIIFLGIVLGLGAGIGIAAISDAMDSTIRSAHDLITGFKLKPVGTIPYVRTKYDTRVSWRKRAMVAGTFVALLLVFASSV